MQTYISYIIIFIFGLAIGSFLNCLAYRLTQKFGWLKKFLRGRSMCPRCSHELSGRDLIPLISFAWLKGKCRYCKHKISWQYPLVEIITATLFVVIFAQQGIELSALFGIGVNVSWLAWKNLFITTVLIVVFLVDYKEMIIPDKVILPAGLIMFFANLAFGIPWYEMILAGLTLSAFFLAQYLISKGTWIGFGDVKFGFVLGLFFGWWGLLVLLLSYLIGGLVATVLLLWGTKKAKSQVAFGPFLVIASFLVLLWGPAIWTAYKGLMLMI